MKRTVCMAVAFIMLFAGCSKVNDGDSSGQTSESKASDVSESKASQAPVTGGETEITINPGEWQLPGTLALPDGEGPFPLVVFVHGSGAADRDETMGKQKLFKDLASDLAKLGIASIRYDKRTYVHGEKMAADPNLTVKEETIDDALFAAAYAKTVERADAGRIYIAGHSMGGYLIPKIDEADTGDAVAGYISLAGSVRSIMELTLEQIDYILSKDTAMSESEKAAYKQQYIDADNAINALTENDRGRNAAIMGAYVTYWLDLAGYKPAEDVLKVKEPLLFLQGGHDYQVTMVDFELWKTALKDNEKARFISYPELSHSFVKTAAMSVPDDYAVYKQIDTKVAEDIRDFITG